MNEKLVLMIYGVLFIVSYRLKEYVKVKCNFMMNGIEGLKSLFDIYEQ